MIEPRPSECQRAIVNVDSAIFEQNTMKLPRRQFLHLTAGAAALSAVSHFAWAQAYPTRAVRLVVGFPPGGAYAMSRRQSERTITAACAHPKSISAPEC